ncbi:nucleotidyltransferase family protein [Megamonas hypermegale]|uniref:nucleotidyltransferase family protein n=1 Tax=Megamonas hypermegale TaxID=158847 RepID=UPI0026F2405E|nr:nucleotidyltransferase domain-containing protein [Megamonas hypermegale]
MLNKEQHLYKQITDIAIKHDADKIILFGSRARKTNNSKSDIDLAVYGCNNFQALYFDLNENVDTLLEFDIIDMNNPYLSDDLIKEIQKDGVVLYEKI